MSENMGGPMSENQIRNSESIGLLLKNIVNEIAAGISESDFQHILSILKNKPKIIKSLYNMQTADIINDIHEMIDKMYSETNIDVKYNEITKLINETEDKNKLAWRPLTGDCEQQLSAYRKKALIEQKLKLEKVTQEERKKRIILKKKLDTKRSHIETLQKNMKIAKAKLIRNSENYIE